MHEKWVDLIVQQWVNMENMAQWIKFKGLLGGNLGSLISTFQILPQTIVDYGNKYYQICLKIVTKSCVGFVTRSLWLKGKKTKLQYVT